MSAAADASNLGHSFKQPAPLQPAALVRTDDDGMYVAVGGPHTSLGLSPRAVRNPSGSAGTSPSNRHLDDSGLVASPPVAAAHNNANTRDGRGVFHSEPVLHSGIRTLSTPRDGVGSFDRYVHSQRSGVQQQQHGRGIGGAPDPDEHNWQYGAGSQKQPWLSGWTTSCCDHPATCLDAACCPWCTHGMQWKRLHETAEQRRDRLDHARFIAQGGRATSAVAYEVGASPGGRGNKRQIDAQDVEDILESKRRQREEHRFQQQQLERDAAATTAETNNKSSAGADAEQQKKKAEEAEAAAAAARPPTRSYYQDDEMYNGYYSGQVGCVTRCLDRCEQIDWGCCAATCFLDLVFLPLLATPFGSVAAQYHIRAAARRKYNLVPAPGSMTEAEEVERRDSARIEAQRIENARREKAEREEAQRRFGERFPEANQRGGAAGGAAASVGLPLETDAVAKKRQQRLAEEEEERLREERGEGCCSNACKEVLVAWWCCCCSAAQVQRELSLRQDYPGGFFSRPLKARRVARASDPNEVLEEELRTLQALRSSVSPARYRGAGSLPPVGARASDESLATHSSALPDARPTTAPPSRHAAAPPPSAHEGRWQGSSSAWMTSASMMTPSAQREQRQHPEDEQQQPQIVSAGESPTHREGSLPSPRTRPAMLGVGGK